MQTLACLRLIDIPAKILSAKFSTTPNLILWTSHHERPRQNPPQD